MDFAQARARLPSMTRQVFGEPVTIRPMRQGEMRSVVDESRLASVDIMGRFDVATDMESLSERRERWNIAKAASAKHSVSVVTSDLASLPVDGDLLERGEGQSLDQFRIVHVDDIGFGRTLLWLSRAAP